MVKPQTLILLLLLTTTANANTINITIDTPNPDLCLSINNLTTITCNKTQTIQLDGTNDYEYYLIPKPPIPTNYTTLQLTTYIATAPLTFIIATAGFIASIIITAILIYWVSNRWMS